MFTGQTTSLHNETVSDLLFIPSPTLMRQYVPELDVLSCYQAVASDFSLAIFGCIPGLEAWKANSGGDMFHILNAAGAALAQTAIISPITVPFILPYDSQIGPFQVSGMYNTQMLTIHRQLLHPIHQQRATSILTSSKRPLLHKIKQSQSSSPSLPA